MVRAKFTVTEIRQNYWNNGKEAVKGSVTVVLSPQYDTSIPEDQRFSKATPSGRLEMLIDNPAAVEYLTPGGSFYIDLTAVPQAEPVSA